MADRDRVLSNVTKLMVFQHNWQGPVNLSFFVIVPDWANDSTLRKCLQSAASSVQGLGGGEVDVRYYLHVPGNEWCFSQADVVAGSALIDTQPSQELESLLW
jgi:hypothetical protein